MRCRGTIAAADVEALAQLLERECATDQRVAVDLLGAVDVDRSIVPVLLASPTTAVISADRSLAGTLTGAGMAVYESLDQATGNHAGVVRRLHDHLREDPAPGNLGADFVAGPGPLQPKAPH